MFLFYVFYWVWYNQKYKGDFEKNMKFDLRKALSEFIPSDQSEAESLEKIKKLIADDKNGDCFRRTRLAGHIVAGALVVDKKGNVLLNHHKALNKWLHFGGHSDGEEDSLNVAKREVFEESGIAKFDDAGGKIMDVDVHIIPENPKKKEPEHLHYDIRFLFIVDDKKFKISDESSEIAWMPISKARKLVPSDSMLRYLDKAQNYVNSLNKNK